MPTSAGEESFVAFIANRFIFSTAFCAVFVTSLICLVTFMSSTVSMIDNSKNIARNTERIITRISAAFDINYVLSFISIIPGIVLFV